MFTYFWDFPQDIRYLKLSKSPAFQGGGCLLTTETLRSQRSEAATKLEIRAKHPEGDNHETLAQTWPTGLVD